MSDLLEGLSIVEKPEVVYHAVNWSADSEAVHGGSGFYGLPVMHMQNLLECAIESELRKSNPGAKKGKYFEYTNLKYCVKWEDNWAHITFTADEIINYNRPIKVKNKSVSVWDCEKEKYIQYVLTDREVQVSQKLETVFRDYMAKHAIEQHLINNSGIIKVDELAAEMQYILERAK